MKTSTKDANPMHTELEIKLAANEVCLDDFLSWGWRKKPSQYRRVHGPDVYYTQGKSVLRHRQSGGAGELTVKQRTSTKSTTNRMEIDLHLDSARTSSDDVASFLVATGWKQALTVVKNAHILYWDRKRSDLEPSVEPSVEVVLYDVECVHANPKKLSKPARYIEVEICKAHSMHQAAIATLTRWETDIRANLATAAPGIASPRSDSL